MSSEEVDTHQKALAINLNGGIYGTFAEIGAGQEIARWFFKVGGAAGTVAKTMSAYDMAVSDDIYGKCGRYVSRERLLMMLDHEYSLLLKRLSASRGAESTFFAFADTVSARNFKGTNQCHGWMGLRFQTEPGGPPNDILLHVSMLDTTNLQQQEALGVLGVNLLYGAFHRRQSLSSLIGSLLDKLSVDRMEIDSLEVSGPAFTESDNKLAGILLLQLGLTNAIIYHPEGMLLRLSEEVYRRPVIIERGYYRAIKQLESEHVAAAHRQFADHNSDSEPCALLEISILDDLGQADLPAELVLDRIDDLWALGHRVLVTRFHEFHQVSSYVRRYTQEPLAFVMSISTFTQIFNARFYTELSGKLLEGIARLFARNVSLIVYGLSRENFNASLRNSSVGPVQISEIGGAVSLDSIALPGPSQLLLRYLRESGAIHSV